MSWAANPTDNSWYDVELLVFAVKNGESRSAETWRNPEDMGISYPAKLVDINYADPTQASNSGKPLNYQTLPKGQQSFDFFKSQMRLNGNFRPLYHNTWRQSVSGPDHALPIIIQGGKQTGDYFELEGSITLSLKRYLHIHTDLWLMNYVRSGGYVDGQVSSPTEIPTHRQNSLNSGQKRSSGILNRGQSTNVYEISRIAELKQTRKMRSGELHYLDHPLMGVVVRLTPFEDTENETESVNEDTAAPQ